MRRAFTLIELLVVVSIIALLIAILLPALSQAMKSSHRTVCGSQIHQHGVGYVAYATDHKGAYPDPARPGHWAFGGLVAAGTTATDEIPAGPLVLFVEGYLDDPHVLYCPSTYQGAGITHDRHWRAQDAIAQPYYHTFSSYQYFAGYQAPGGATLDHSVLASGSMDEERGDILSMDLIVYNAGWWMSNHIGDDSIPIGFNQLMIDQSVSWVFYNDRLGDWTHAGRIFSY